MVSGSAGWLCPGGSCCGSRAAGPLHRAAQSSGLAACETGAAVSAGVPQQDGIQLHHGTRPPGAAARLLKVLTVAEELQDSSHPDHTLMTSFPPGGDTGAPVPEPLLHIYSTFIYISIDCIYLLHNLSHPQC